MGGKFRNQTFLSKNFIFADGFPAKQSTFAEIFPTAHLSPRPFRLEAAIAVPPQWPMLIAKNPQFFHRFYFFWYSAADNGIVLGYGNGCFGPEDPITREQMVAILYRYAKSKEANTAQNDISLRAFNDGESISSYAVNAMEWAVNTGIIQGYNGNLMPTGNATRAQVAAILHRFGEHISK